MFSGATYNHARDYGRLGAQMLRVFNVMRDGEWRTLADIATATGDPQASVSARLRDLRKERFGGATVERKYRGRGLFAYRLAALADGAQLRLPGIE
jgi:hypothetical protein